MRFIILFISCVLLSCSSDTIFQEFQTFDGYWPENEVKTFSVDVPSDTAKYDITMHFTTTHKYPYNNLYFDFELTLDDSLVEKNLNEIILSDPKTGEPFGSGAGDVFENSILVLEKFQFPQTGNFEIKVTHFMRMDSLPEINKLGIVVEASQRL